MLQSVRIENFRCFSYFELKQLGRLNLLVGNNNSGKTSILEAIKLLYSQDLFRSLYEIMSSRGEYAGKVKDNGIQELDIRHLFHNRELKVENRISISGFYHDKEEELAFTVQENKQSNILGSSLLAVNIDYIERENGHFQKDKYAIIEIPLSIGQGFPVSLKYWKEKEFENSEIYFFRKNREVYGKTIQYLTTASLNNREIIRLFNQIVLEPEESLVIEALQIIEPHIQRIAPTDEGEIVARLNNDSIRIPFGSMGDGMQKMLGLILVIINARNGILLVDEIDTGLHFTAMTDMWKLIWETAKRLNVQVFATTHSSDCWTSLAAIASTENPSEEGISIQRIEKDKLASIVFTERQIAIAAERGIEVR